MESVIILTPSFANVDRRVYKAAIKAAVFAERNGIRINDVECTHRELPHRARNILADVFRKDGSAWSFWIDDDVTVPENAIVELITETHKRELSASTGLIYSRMTGEPLVYNKENIVFSQYTGPLTEPVIIGGAGMGCTLVHRTIFNILEEPFFDWTRLNEDLYFFKKIQDFGFKLLLVPSVVCGHIMDSGIK